MRTALRLIAPLLGVRLVIATALLGLLTVTVGSAGLPRRARYGHAALGGCLLHVGYLGEVL